MTNNKALQFIPIIPAPAFDLGSLDGYADALHGAPCAPDVVFARRHKRRPVEEFTDYEQAYRASYAQVKAGGQ